MISFQWKNVATKIGRQNVSDKILTYNSNESSINDKTVLMNDNC